MGMFDTFYLQDKGRTLEVQSKEFACVLSDYRFGDFVIFDAEAPRGVTAYIEDHKENWQDTNCPVEWIVLLLVDSCFVDGFVATTQSEAQAVADAMVQLWAAPERQAEAFKRFANEHFLKRTDFYQGLSSALKLLRDFEEWSTAGIEKNKLFAFLRHDFDAESWDVGLARVLKHVPEFAEHLPEKYQSLFKQEEVDRNADKDQ